MPSVSGVVQGAGPVVVFGGVEVEVDGGVVDLDLVHLVAMGLEDLPDALFFLGDGVQLAAQRRREDDWVSPTPVAAWGT